jgi:hypothetical protein
MIEIGRDVPRRRKGRKKVKKRKKRKELERESKSQGRQRRASISPFLRKRNHALSFAREREKD